MITEEDINEVRLHLRAVIGTMKVTPAMLAPILGTTHVSLYRWGRGDQVLPDHLARWIATFAAADRAQPGIVLWACEHVEFAGHAAIPLAVFAILGALFAPPAVPAVGDRP